MSARRQRPEQTLLSAPGQRKQTVTNSLNTVKTQSDVFAMKHRSKHLGVPVAINNWE